MNVDLVRQDIEKREQYVQNLEGSLLYLQQDAKTHEEAISLVGYELYFIHDQLFNYHILLNLLQEENDVTETDL